MLPLLTSSLGQSLLSVLTSDYGMPGHPRRRALLDELQRLRALAEAEDAPLQVRHAIRSSLRALRFEFPDTAGAWPSVAPLSGDAARSRRPGRTSDP
jgi:hypothetical protein